MSIILKYTKHQYLAKIEELQGLYTQLATHLSKMEGLKSQMFQFWDDANGQQAGIALAGEITAVSNAMDRTQEMLTLYKKSVEKLDATNSLVSGDLADVISKISKLS